MEDREELLVDLSERQPTLHGRSTRPLHENLQTQSSAGAGMPRSPQYHGYCHQHCGPLELYAAFSG